MKFSIMQEWEHGFSQYKLTDLSLHTSVTILPQYGGALHAWNLHLTDGPINIIDNYADRQTLEQEFDRSYKSAKLSPFVCRTRDGKYDWKGHHYEFAKKFSDGSAIHGILFNKEFTVVECTASDEGAQLVLKYHYDKDDPAYPFQYTCSIIYTLQAENKLSIATILENTGEEEIPIADGWHPYFSLGGIIDDYQLQFNAERMLEFDTALLPTGRYTKNDSFIEDSLLGNRFLDNSFLVTPKADHPVCVVKNKAAGISLSFLTDNSYPYLQIFTPGHRKSIAVENLSSAPDCFNNKIGLITLQPGEVKNLLVEYKVDIVN
jgi:aldose 1-epimerase